MPHRVSAPDGKDRMGPLPGRMKGMVQMARGLVALVAAAVIFAGTVAEVVVMAIPRRR